MNEMDLLKTILHKLAQIERQMIKKEDFEELSEQLIIQEEQIEVVHELLEDLQVNVDVKHRENINSDEILLRYIREPV
ncbi:MULTISPECIES: hypothetical protein [Bacillaceae]|uniref:Uncharacterized protein n=1 Tax=Evansella alkalicola TaxID=745819 RepID=A0ABS6JUL8_9BACI|nr:MULTISPECIES: hypothetical protein [Bacillaceae]MBU9722270.1 hypothetical protein [Bacillus alkalicola]